MPAPLTPTMPTRSPGPKFQSTPSSSTRFAERQRDAVQLVDRLAEPGGREALQRDVVARRRLVGDERVGRVDAELRLAGARGRAAAQPGELLLHQLQALLLGRRGHAVALGAGQDVRRVAALVGVDDAVVDLPGAGVDLVEEPAVVGDDEVGLRGRPRCLRCAASQATPSTSRWLVGSSSTSRSHSCTSSDASATRRRSPPDIVPMTLSRPMPCRPSPSSTSRTRASPAQVCSAVSPRTAWWAVSADVDADVLGEHADAQAAGVRDPAGVRLLGLDERLEQGGLAAAVAADDADAVALGDAERDAVHEQPGAVRDGDVLEVDQVDGHQRASTTRAPPTGPSARRTSAQAPGLGQRRGQRGGVGLVAGEDARRSGRSRTRRRRARRARGRRRGPAAAPGAAPARPAAGRCRARGRARPRRPGAARTAPASGDGRRR